MDSAKILWIILFSAFVFGFFYSTFIGLYHHYTTNDDGERKDKETTRTSEMADTDWSSEAGVTALQEVVVVDVRTHKYTGVVETVTELRDL